MSYILDALVKADLERQRRSVPGLNTIQVPLSPAGGARERWPAWAGGAMLLAVALVLAWGRLGPGPVGTATGQAGEAPLSPKPAVLPANPGPEAKAVIPEGAAISFPPPAARRDAPPDTGPKAAEETRTRPDSRLYAIAELPPALQKEAQQIKVAGFAQASDANERLAIINDRALREGDEVTTGLRVERISGDGVVFNLKGYRFRKGGA